MNEDFSYGIYAYACLVWKWKTFNGAPKERSLDSLIPKANDDRMNLGGEEDKTKISQDVES